MTPESLCMGCMEEKGLAEVCPKCEWKEGTEPDNPMQFPPRTVLNGRYVLGRVLGQGGFGITYLAWDKEAKKKRAVKEHFPQGLCTRSKNGLTIKPLNPDAFDYGVGKFEEEANVQKRFKGHPCIVEMHDFFRVNGTAYLVMEYVDGYNLEEYLRRSGGKISFDLAARTLTPVMDALREVHAEKFLHRDLSPSNIYVNHKNQVKLGDFGSTRQAIQDRTQNFTVTVKGGYTAIEQFGGLGKQGAWTDVYGVAATLYRATTGRMPQPSPSRLVDDELLPPSSLGIAIRAEQEAALLKGLSVLADGRFRTIDEFQRALARNGSGTSTTTPEVQNRDSLLGIALLLIAAFFAIFLIVPRPQPQMTPTRPETNPVIPSDSSGVNPSPPAVPTDPRELSQRGDDFYYGRGVRKSYQEAAKWYREAAEEGNAYAQYSLGFLYENGQGLLRDYTQALKWYRQAAEQGDASAQYSLGFMYENGEGAPKELDEAVRWYRKAGAQNNTDADSRLAHMYVWGLGLSQDYVEAAKLYRKAAERGNAEAQYSLGFMYENGNGVPRDYAEALKWYRKAAAQGNVDAKRALGQ